MRYQSAYLTRLTKTLIITASLERGASTSHSINSDDDDDGAGAELKHRGDTPCELFADVFVIVAIARIQAFKYVWRIFHLRMRLGQKENENQSDW